MVKRIAIAALLSAVALSALPEKTPTAKEVMTAVQEAVLSLQKGALEQQQVNSDYEYALGVLNARTLELHRDVEALKSRGPVAQNLGR